jgi:hypothetical protein
MKLVDDRTKEEKVTHPWIVAATDTFLSGWGKAKGGASYCGWACKFRDIQKVMTWVCSRGDMKHVRLVSGNWRPKGVGHTHIYVVNDGHTSLY